MALPSFQAPPIWMSQKKPEFCAMICRAHHMPSIKGNIFWKYCSTTKTQASHVLRRVWFCFYFRWLKKDSISKLYQSSALLKKNRQLGTFLVISYPRYLEQFSATFEGLRVAVFHHLQFPFVSGRCCWDWPKFSEHAMNIPRLRFKHHAHEANLLRQMFLNKCFESYVRQEIS